MKTLRRGASRRCPLLMCRKHLANHMSIEQFCFNDGLGPTALLVAASLNGKDLSGGNFAYAIETPVRHSLLLPRHIAF